MVADESCKWNISDGNSIKDNMVDLVAATETLHNSKSSMVIGSQ